MQNVFKYIRECNLFKKIEVGELLFVEFKCLVEEIRFGMWSDANYFVFVTNGKKMWKTHRGEYIVEAGDALFVKKGANIAHQFHSEDYCALMIFMPDDFIKKFMIKYSDFFDASTEYKKDDSDGVLRIEMNDFLWSYVKSLEAYFSMSVNPDHKMICLKFEELLLSVFTQTEHSRIALYLNSIHSSRHSQLTNIMNENYTYNLKLEDYATLCNMSLSTFKRTFNTVFQETPAKWLNKQKVQRASNILKTTNTSISQIALDCGFEDPSHFTKVFKRFHSQTPLAYRNSNSEQVVAKA